MILAGDGNVKQRLQRAYEENLATLSEDDLPGDLHGDFFALRSRMTSVPPVTGEGPVRATVRKMSTKEASHCAVAVISMYGEMIRRSANATRRDEAVPYLVKTAN
jgi:hypothetical protein